MRAALPRLLQFVTANLPPATSLPETKADLHRLVTSIRSLQHGFARVAALVASNDFVNPSRFTEVETRTFYRTIFQLPVDIPELRLRFTRAVTASPGA